MKEFNYITLKDMVSTIRDNIYKIPRDIDFVIGVPRSGMIAASIISEYINVPLIDLNSFIEGVVPSGGHRLELFKSNTNKKVLVIDDTTFSGKAMNETKKKLAPFKDYNFIYSVVYLEGEFGAPTIDLCLEDIRYRTKEGIQMLYEWNLFNHYPHIMNTFMFDIDGVFCIENGRPDDMYESEYEEYIKNAKPRFIPRVPINSIVTYRISKYEDITKNWLKENGIQYKNLYMFKANDWRERNYSGISAEKMKADIYKNSDCKLFIESNDIEAQRICAWSGGKQVLCIDSNRLYG